MTPQKKWPENAEWARLDSIALAQQGSNLLEEILYEVDDPEHLRRIAVAIKRFEQIKLKLVQAKGATQR